MECSARAQGGGWGRSPSWVVERTGAEGEENSLSKDVHSASQFTQISPSCGDCSHRVFVPHPHSEDGETEVSSGN